MNTYFSGLLWVIAAAVSAGLIGYAVRRFGLDEGRPGNNDAAGQVFVIVSGMHAVVLAFVMVTLFDAVGVAREGAYREAQSLVAVSWAAEALSDETAQRVRTLSRAYAHTVIAQEWPGMRRDRGLSGNGWSQLDRIREAVLVAPASGEWQEGRKAAAMDRLRSVYQQRQDRLNMAFHRDVSTVVWFVLILGSVLVVLLPNLFGGTRLMPHVMIVSTLAGTLALLVFAVYHLQNPFAGDSRIDPAAFRWALERLGSDR
ncbi:Protein of unknown function [Actinopolyspora mzabensis]|uniref:DUF4239 domain-containing protein n=1 Tax=Actinopolyspora mzabensis TaxID=995066 RepID=A0A1G8Y2J6_ACTMZ|nr:DUF4239 domain-containing protein [Actinopolyspora mzabensis]SDJ97048.1 Protein of unknown function [Actinopolyspora mzabensis]